jgi:hypothetical protein
MEILRYLNSEKSLKLNINLNVLDVLITLTMVILPLLNSVL